MGKLQQEVGILNQGDELRETIAACERGLVSVTRESVADLLTGVITAHRLLDDLRAGGADVRAEEARLRSVDERMVNNAGRIVAAAGGVQSFVALRQRISPHTREPWWLLDEAVQAARRARMRRIVIGVVAVAVLGVVGFLLRGVLFPPDPVGDAVYAVQAALRDGDVQRAVQAVDRGLSEVPDSATLLIWKGVLLTRQNDPAGAAALEAARARLDERDYWLEKAQVDLILGNNDQVIADLSRLIERMPDLAEAYYIRASAFENRNEPWRAIQDLETTAQIAERTGNDTLFATARVRMGVLMQTVHGGRDDEAEGQPTQAP